MKKRLVCLGISDVTRWVKYGFKEGKTHCAMATSNLRIFEVKIFHGLVCFY